MKHLSLGRRKKPHALTIGAVFVALAVIGAIAVIGFCVKGTIAILDNTKEKEKFADVVMPVLMFDPVPYENASDLDPSFVLRSSVWAALLEKKDTYIYDNMNRMTVPSTDVDVACARLFGSDIKLEHKSFETYTAATYVYHEEGKAYLVPIESETILYTPEVVDIDKKGDTYTLLVGYVSPGNTWILQDTEDGTPKPDKYMQYVLQENDNGSYRLIAIQDPPEGVVTAEMLNNVAQPPTNYSQNMEDVITPPVASGDTAEPAPDEDTESEETEEDETEEESEEDESEDEEEK